MKHELLNMNRKNMCTKVVTVQMMLVKFMTVKPCYQVYFFTVFVFA